MRSAVLGALNLLAVETGEMRPVDVEVAQAFADAATNAVLPHRASLEAALVNDQLDSALKVWSRRASYLANRLAITTFGWWTWPAQ